MCLLLHPVLLLYKVLLTRSTIKYIYFTIYYYHYAFSCVMGYGLRAAVMERPMYIWTAVQVRNLYFPTGCGCVCVESDRAQLLFNYLSYHTAIQLVFYYNHNSLQYLCPVHAFGFPRFVTVQYGFLSRSSQLCLLSTLEINNSMQVRVQQALRYTRTRTCFEGNQESERPGGKSV